MAAEPHAQAIVDEDAQPKTATAAQIAEKHGVVRRVAAYRLFA